MLVLGWKRGRQLQAGRLKLAVTMDQELRERAQATLTEIGQRSPRGYEPTAHLEEDEVFLLTVDQLPRRPVIRRRGRPRQDRTAPHQQVEASSLIQLLAAPEELDLLDADDVRGRSFLYYAAVFSFSQGGDTPIAFIKHHNVATILKSGRLLGLFGQTVTRVEQPVLVFERDFDLILDDQEIAVLSPNAVPQLFADVEITAAAVPEYVAMLGELQLLLSDETKDALTRVCAKSRLLAGRLERLLAQPHVATLTPAKVRDYLQQTGQDVDRFLQGEKLAVAEEDLGDFLDVLGQLHYLGGYDELLRRADRSSLVK